MTPNEQVIEIQSLKAQVNALTQLLLHSVAVLEMNGLVDGAHLQSRLCKLNWPEPINDEARSAMNELCSLLADARGQRLSQGQDY